jgi:hypothetical protein
MGRSLKIVVIALTIYALLSFYSYQDKGFWVIPYHYNPLTILIVSAAILINSNKSTQLFNLIYFTAAASYCFLSVRTLTLIHMYFHFEFINNLINSPFPRLIQVLVFYSSLAVLTVYMVKVYKITLINLALLTVSFIFGLLNYDLISIILFNLYVLMFGLFLLKKTHLNPFTPVFHQLILFITLENLYFYFN